MKNLKNKSMVLSVALAAVLSFGMTGCGSDDVANALTGGTSGISGSGTITSIDISQHVSQTTCDKQAAAAKEYAQSWVTYQVEYSQDNKQCSDYGLSDTSYDDESYDDLKDSCYSYDYGSGSNGSCVMKATANIADIQKYAQDNAQGYSQYNAPSRLAK